MMTYIYQFKRLRKQELGSQAFRGSTKTSRGRYLYLSKNENFLKFFPPLSTTQKNDCVLISLTPVWENAPNVKEYCTLVFHNSKIMEDRPNGRDEYRIYISKNLGTEDFFENDIVVFRKVEKDNEENSVENTTEYSYNYFIDWAKEGDKNFNIYNDILISNKLSNKNTSYGIYEGYIEIFERNVNRLFPTQNIIIPEKTIQQVVSIQGTKEEIALSQQLGTTGFRDFILIIYGNTCAISNSVISYRNINNLEAAHIYPRHLNGLNLPSNGIALRRDLHWAFDQGMFTFDDNFKIIIADEIKNQNTYLNNYADAILKPRIQDFSPRKDFLKFHRENIFRKFTRTK